MMEPLALKAAIGQEGHTEAIIDGTVAPAGFRIDRVEVKPMIAAFRRMVRDVEFDVCVMPCTTYMLAKEFKRPFTAIPVFISRSFHHAARGFAVNTDSDIKEPKDLEGRKAGVRAYTVTTGVWARGILQSEYGVDLSKITWVTDDEEHVTEWVPPSNVVKAPDGRSLAEMFAAGEIDAALTDAAGIGRAGAPTANWEAAATNVAAKSQLATRHLIPNAKEEEIAAYKRTGVYPIHGVVVIKDSLIREYPQLGIELFKAFKASKELYLKRLAEKGPATKFDQTQLEKMALVGPDPLPYGFERNRPSLQALMDYAHNQGIISEATRPEEFFVANTLDLD
jgi:4,5-dihydroxyphthalate decarboxylase